MSKDVPLPDDLAKLKALLLRERQRHAQVVTHHEQVISEYEETLESQRRKLQQQEHTIAQLLRRLCGPKQERVDPNQLMLFDVAELEALLEEQQNDPPDETEDESLRRRPRRKGGHGRNRLPENLPREQVVHELSEEERRCPCCGEPRVEIGRETSEQLEYVPATLKVIVHERIKYACRHCQEHVAIAPKPPQPIERGLPGPGLLAHTVLSKYGDHLPLYRQEDILARYGVTIRRSTLCNWMASAADLATPLYERMCRRVLQSAVVHTDDTSVKLLDPSLGHARGAHFWAYIGDRQNPYSVYDFTDSRARDGPAKFLDGFEGYLQADAYGGYDGIYSGSSGKIVEVACWTHCRRYWWEARTTDSRRAHHALGYIGRLYQLEDQFRERTDDERRDLRIEHTLPILDEFRRWLDEQAGSVLPKSPIAKALTYTLNQWEALRRYTEDGRLCIDNNISERTVKIPAIGRKNWMFVASESGGHRAAILFSLVASCKANQVEPFAYLRDIFTRLPTQPADSLDDLMPDVWLTVHPEHRWEIDEVRRKERRSRRGRPRRSGT